MMSSTASAAAHASGLPPNVDACGTAPPGCARETRGRLLAARDRADRHAAAEALGERHHVGRDVVVLVTEPRAGAADAGLHLVEDQDRAGVVAQPAQAGEVARRRRR